MRLPKWKTGPKTLSDCYERRKLCLDYIKWASIHLAPEDKTTAVSKGSLWLLSALAREAELSAVLERKRLARAPYTMTAL